MYYLVKHCLRTITTSSFRTSIRRFRRHLKQPFSGRKTTLEEFRVLLTDQLGIKKGDWLLVSSSFGNLNADFSPRQAIEMLQSIVSEEGLIMMPYYPPLNSDEWAEKSCTFDMLETKSGMGILTNVFSAMPGVRKSIHPTKAVCCWGQELYGEKHFKAKTPYYWDSPYGEMLKHGSKSLCLGITNMPIIHAVEDILSAHYYDYYCPEKKRLKVRLSDGSEVVAETYIHDHKILSQCISGEEYARSLELSTYHRVSFGLKCAVVVDNQELFDVAKVHFAKGHTRIR